METQGLLLWQALRRFADTIRISTKITTSFIVVACMMLVVGLVSIAFIHQLLEDEEYTFHHQVVPLKILSGISEEFTKARVFVRDIVNRPDRSKYLDSLASVKKALARLNGQYSNTIFAPDSEEGKIFRTYSSGLEMYFSEYIEPIADAVRSGDVDKAREQQLRMSNFATVVGAFHSLQMLKQREVETTKNAHHTRATLIKNTLLVSILLGFVLAVGLGWWIGRLIGTPITEMRSVAASVAEGDLNVKMTPRSQDELGALGESINQMIQAIRFGIWNLEQSKKGVEQQVERAIHDIENQREYLSQSVETMLASVEQLSRGNLTEHLPVTSNDDIGRLFAGYNRAVEQIGSTLTTVMEGVSQTASAAEQILSSVEEISSSVQQQSAYTKTIASSIEEMKYAMNDDTEQATQAASQADATSTAAQEGGRVIQQTIEAMNRIAGVVEHSAERVEELGRSNEQISEILRVIEEIADQTNLLALNASIEAARAGEHGRGFAVVADEVRKLAERTQQATKEIGSTIRLVQNGTREAVQSMKSGTHEVESGRRSVAASQQALSTILQQTQGVAAIIRQLAAASAEHATASTEIADNAAAMSSMLDETVSATHDIARSTHQLNDLMMNVERQVLQFQLQRSQPSPQSSKPTLQHHFHP
jgi:methyl-accepting chemotaxis protein